MIAPGKYEHGEGFHNLDSPNEIVPYVIDLLKPKSVVDFGCGIGTFLAAFKNNGVDDILGLDGVWVDMQLLEKYIPRQHFQTWDLEKAIILNRKYDLVISLEVAEHLSEEAADTFVDSLSNAGDVILFSAAIPNQGGQNHINEQWLDYWEEKFALRGLTLYDTLRPIFWDNPKIFWWYKQNMVIFSRHSLAKDNPSPYKNVVHPEFYDYHEKQWQSKWADVVDGKWSSFEYLKLLLKSLIGRDRFKKLKKMIGD